MDRVRIGLEDDGRVIALTVGEPALLALPENPTTGFRWAIERQEGPLEVHDLGNTPEQGAAVGAAATRTFELAPSAPGPAAIHLVLAREWEGPSSIEARLSCSFDISPPTGE